jgi:hypothetical protein
LSRPSKRARFLSRNDHLSKKGQRPSLSAKMENNQLFDDKIAKINIHKKNIIFGIAVEKCEELFAAPNQTHIININIKNLLN